MSHTVEKWICFVIIVCCLGGCSWKGDMVQPEEPWQGEGFQVSSKVDDAEGYYVAHFDAWSMDGVVKKDSREIAYGMTPAKVWRHKTYRLYAMIEPPVLDVSRWYLVIYDAESGQHETKEITYELLGITKESEQNKLRYLIDVDMVDEENFVFQWVTVSAEDGLYWQSSDVRIFTDLKGNKRQVELWDTLEKNHLVSNEAEEFSFLPEASCVTDGRGNLYGVAVSEEGAKLWVMDQNAELILEHPVSAEWHLTDILRTDQDMVLCLFDDEKNNMQRFLWMDIDGKEGIEVAAFPGEEHITKLYGMSEAVIYYEVGEKGQAFAWNIRTGKRSLFLDYKENNISGAYGIEYVFAKGKEPLIRLSRNTDLVSGETEDWLVSVAREKVDRQVSIELLVTDDEGSKMITEAASLAARKNPNALFQCKKAATKEQKDLLMAELIAGNGPDVMYLPRSDFEALAGKGLFLDLTELIEKDLQEKLLPGALDLGKIDGVLYGLPVCVQASSLLVEEGVWAGASWTFEDMMGLMREGKLDGSVYYVNSGTVLAPLASTMAILSRCLHDPALIDWEAKKCYFTNEDFIDFLAFEKKADISPDSDAWLKGGCRIADIDMNSYDFIYEFCVREEAEGGHYVGFPTEYESGNFLNTDGVLVVRSGTEKKEAATDLLNCILTPDIQGTEGNGTQTALSVLKMELSELAYEEDGKWYVDGKEVGVLEDGKTSVEAAEEFLESCVAAPVREVELENILREEVAAFYQEKKTAREVAEILQNRIQLFLDEL